MTSESKIKQIINILTTLKEVTESESMSREQCDRANAKSIEESNLVLGETTTFLEEALCDIDAVASNRLADLEEALCELSEIMEEGGNGNG